MAEDLLLVVSLYAPQHFTGYSPGHCLTSPGVWSSVHHRTAPAPDVAPPRPAHDTRTLDRGGVCAGVIPARYSMTYVKRYQRWFIVDHHSSVIGEPSCKSITP